MNGYLFSRFIRIPNILALATLCHITATVTDPRNENQDPHEHIIYSNTSEAFFALITITALIAISILFELFTDFLRESCDEMNMPFINRIFSELTTLGFIGLLLFIITQLHLLAHISMHFFGEAEKLQEMIEYLHMGLFFFVLFFLLLCCVLLRQIVFIQAQWRRYERGAGDLASVISNYALAVDEASDKRRFSYVCQHFLVKDRRQEMTFLSLRRRFLNYRSNHPNLIKAHYLAKEFQLDPNLRFPFHEYLSIISGESMAYLISIEPSTWVALDIVLVVLRALCWNADEIHEIWIFIIFGYVLAAIIMYLSHATQKVCELMIPPEMFRDAERLRCNNVWRANHRLELLSVNEHCALLHATPGRVEEDGDVLDPAYVKLLPSNSENLSECQLANIQQQILFRHPTNGRKNAIFVIRLILLLAAMQMSIFLLRSARQIHNFYGSKNYILVLIVYVVYLAPGIYIMIKTPGIARDGIYASSVEHLKSSRVITKVMRVQKARQTLRTLRFVAEMKIHLRDTDQPQNSPAHEASSSHAIEHYGKSFAKSASLDLHIPKRLRSARCVSRAIKDTLAHTTPSVFPQMPLSPLASCDTAPIKNRDTRYSIEAERREINTIFCLFDMDGSGFISRDEMANLLLAITHEVDEHQIDRLMRELIVDPETTEVSFEAFYQWCHQHIHDSKHSKDALTEEIFRIVDTDHSGFITVDEFISVFKTLGQALDHEDVRELVYQMDRDQDGKIDLEEFKKMLHKHDI